MNSRISNYCVSLDSEKYGKLGRKQFKNMDIFAARLSELLTFENFPNITFQKLSISFNIKGFPFHKVLAHS